MRFWVGLLLLGLWALPLQAQNRTEFMTAFQYQAIDGLDAEQRASLRTYTTFYENQGGTEKGWMLLVDFYSYLWAPDATLGYGARWGGATYFELAGGGSLSLLDGVGATGLASVGTELGGGWYLSFPVVYKVGRALDGYFLLGVDW